MLSQCIDSLSDSKKKKQSEKAKNLYRVARGLRYCDWTRMHDQKNSKVSNG